MESPNPNQFCSLTSNITNPALRRNATTLGEILKKQVQVYTLEGIESFVKSVDLTLIFFLQAGNGITV